MKVSDLKKLLEEADDDMEVYLPANTYFDGRFLHPCMEESGVAELTIDEETGKTEYHFMLVPCGYFELHDEGEVNPILN